MKVTLNRIDNFHVSVANDTGHEIHLDNKSASSEPQGASPMELLLMGIAGCSSIDIVAILNKQKLDPSSLRMEVEGHRQEGKVPSLFDRIHVQVSRVFWPGLYILLFSNSLGRNSCFTKFPS